MLARLQANAAMASSVDTAEGASQLEELRREHRERWRAERAETVDDGRRNVGNDDARGVPGDAGHGAEDTRSTPSQAPAPPDMRASAHLDARMPPADDRDHGSNRGFVFGAALGAGLLGYRAARALHRAFQTDPVPSTPDELERRRRRAQETADAALAARLQREEEMAYARDRATVTTPRRSSPIPDREGEDDGTATGPFFWNAREISLGPFGTVRFETATIAPGFSAADPFNHHQLRDGSDRSGPDGYRSAAEVADSLLRARAEDGAFPPHLAASLVGLLRGVFADEDALEAFAAHAAGLEATAGSSPPISGTSEAVLAALPTREYRASSSEDGAADVPPPTCAVCVCDAEEGERLRRLPCAHEFHVACVDRWLRDHRTCPMCKDDVVEAVARRRPPASEAT